jgi:hypothetical protein
MPLCLLSTPTNTPEQLAEAMSFRHSTVMSIMTARLEVLKAAQQIWEEDGLKRFMYHMSKLQDSAVLVDILRVICAKPRLLTLELAAMLLPLVSGLLFEVYEEYLMQPCAKVSATLALRASWCS